MIILLIFEDHYHDHFYYSFFSKLNIISNSCRLFPIDRVSRSPCHLCYPPMNMPVSFTPKRYCPELKTASSVKILRTVAIFSRNLILYVYLIWNSEKAAPLVDKVIHLRDS